MYAIDQAFLGISLDGSRQIVQQHLRGQGWTVGRNRVCPLISKIGVAPIYQAPKTSKLNIERLGQTWWAELIYVLMRRGFL